MESSVHKQYLLLHEKPVLYYALKAFEESPVQEIVLVVGKGEIEYCQKEISRKKYGFSEKYPILSREGQSGITLSIVD